MRMLIRINVAIIAIFVAMSFYLLMPKLLLAQEPGGEQSPSSEGPSAGELTATSELTSTGEAGFRDIIWADLDYNDLRLNPGSRPATRYTFNVPGDLRFIPGSFFNLVVSHSAAELEKPASLTIDLNDHALGIVQLTEENDNRAQIQLDILPEQLKTGSNELRVSLAAGDSCFSDDLPVSAILHGEGLVHLTYTVVPREPDLVEYPVPFYERAFETSTVYFVLPDVPTPDDITVAATISAGLGRYSSGDINVKSVTASDLTDEIRSNYNLIVIGLPETNSLLSELPLPLSVSTANIADNQGVLQEIRSPWNPRRMVLAVTGKTYDGVFKAGAALNRQILFPSLRGQVVVVEALLDPPVDEFEPFKADVTFEELGNTDQVIYGAKPASQRFDFSLPTSWQMSENPSLRLYFTHSEVLSNAVSTLDVHLNNVPVGSTLLDHSNSKDGVLDIEFPQWLLRSGRNSIEVFIDMAIAGGDECVNANSRQAWTVINRASQLHLPYEAQATELDLANLFQPLTDAPNLNDTYFALPEILNQAEQDAFLNLAVRLGAAARGNYLELRAGWVNNLSPDIKQAYYIVTIGQPRLNPLIRAPEVNDILPQPFLAGSNEPSQIHNPAIIAFDPERSIGFVQLMTSPWNPDKALLVVTGTDDDGVAAASDLLINRLGELEGNLAMIEAEDLVTIDTRPLQVNRKADVLSVIRPDESVFVAQAERWW